jgi:hypothetical protein
MVPTHAGTWQTRGGRSRRTSDNSMIFTDLKTPAQSVLYYGIAPPSVLYFGIAPPSRTSTVPRSISGRHYPIVRS